MTIRILNCDVMDGLRQLPDESVHCVVTSPPYYGLRDYQTGTWDGGDPGCDHTAVRRGHGENEKQASSAGTSRDKIVGGDCRLCGAKRIDHQIGLEPTPDVFVSRLVDVFRDVRRVLRSDGTLWLNMGDSYASTTSATGARGGSYAAERSQWEGVPTRREIPPGLKTKDLVGVPWMLAFALRADGWWLRSDIIWAKPNPMPESVTDRPTKAHEYIFLLTKSERYFYDSDAIREDAVKTGSVAHLAGGKGIRAGTRAGLVGCYDADAGRNKRSVWTIATAPFAEAHFATFPPEIPEICIKAGCPVGGTVLDPFSGAGTTCLVADRLQRNGIGIELNPEYAAMAERRIQDDRGGLLDIMEAAE
jgi:DNA modification methylase